MSTSSLKHLIVSCACVLLLACSRSGGDGDSVPRRLGYVRVADYPAEYAVIDSLPLRIEANSRAQTSVERQDAGVVWLNITYPDYKARVYVTLTPVDASTVEGALENRAERIGLNLGGAETESEHFSTPEGYYVTLIKSPQALPTPVHFLAVNPEEPKWLISGAAMLEGVGANAPADSIAPVIDTIYRDISYAMSRLSTASGL